MEPIDQARRYFKGIPPAISGSGGHAQAFSAASVLINGFALTRSDAEQVFREYNQLCQPPWSDREINHKLSQAESTPHDKPRGHLLSKGSPAHRHTPMSSPRLKSQPASAKPATKRHGSPKTSLPEPIADGARKLLAAVFREGDGIRIVAAKLNDEGHEIPDGSGVILTREEWLKKLDAKNGNPNAIFKSADKAGIYIGLNPLKIGGKAQDDNVTDFRYALLEFDGLSREEQFGLYEASKIPCAAIISSGGKSVHAWVKIEAKDRNEFNERVAVLYSHFEAYGLDGKNKNPARLSRLPNCERFTKRQELLALNAGASSFVEWATETESDSLGDRLSIADLMTFDASRDDNSILGDRWACRSGSILFIGQSGVGKSSLSIQMAILWALGRAAFGIQPAKPLRSLFIQAENDFGDVAEMFQGVIAGMQLSAEEIEQVKKMLVVRRNSHHTGQAFTQTAQRLIDIEKPDLCWVDPLMAYIGDDISKQSVCSQFFRNWINPISDATKVCWMMMHHTNKPLKEPKKTRKGWTVTDYAYEGAGSAELVNWARGVCLLQRGEDDNFQLLLAKRGKRAAAKDLQNVATIRIHLKHSDLGICWHQIEAEEPAESEKKSGGRPKSKFDFDAFVASITGTGHLRLGELVTKAAKFGDMSERSVYRKVLEELKTKLKYDADFETYSV